MTVNINAGNISSIRLVEQSSAPAAPSGAAARLYVNNDTPRRLSIRDSSGVTTFLGNTSGSGAGITFPNSASTNATTLDWYEETTWTPVVEGSGTAGTMGGTVFNTGLVTRIGRMVFAQAYIEYTSHTGSGDMFITGLPFTSASSTSGRSVGHLVTRLMNWSGGTQMKLHLTSNSNVIVVYGMADDADWTVQQIVNEPTRMQIYIAYMV